MSRGGRSNQRKPKRSSRRGTRSSRAVRDRFKREQGARELRERVLIVCEGAETEVGYFEGFRKHHHLSTLDVRVVGGDEAGTHPHSIIQHAEKLLRTAAREGDPFDRAWAVVDRDDHQDIGQAIAQPQERKAKPQIRMALSNPCFEVWYLQHYRYSTRCQTRDEASAELRKLLGGRYEKSDRLFDELLPQQAEAIRNAGRLRKHHEDVSGHQAPWEHNPRTDVDILVAFLNGLMK
ncbi:MAG: hypothetical protein GF320_20720 [Armatimonadia bacterium]|nr:hypothetical protein [Armatimonadia bacterium]